jgi:phosphoglycolate phosphatase-like HAD superfamily hydrolase|tara:strand:- start:33 stop:374 length:342 start_codon:yes stop_codon:yes gene_type:complete
MFIAPGTPQGELRDIVKQRSLSTFFDRVYGSPRSKSDISRMILAENNLSPDQAVFIGDAVGDHFSARDVSVPFVGCVPKGQPDPFPYHGVVAVVQDLRGLELEWQSLLDRTPS